MIPRLEAAARPRWRPTPLVTGSAGLHAAALATVALAPQLWPAAAGAAFANHCLLAAAGLWPQGRWLGPNLSRLPVEAAQRNEVALTFDDGPDPVVTPRVLDLLDRAGARATFFCIGRRAADHPELTAEIVRRGHRLGNHTFSHPMSFAFYPPGAMAREIGRAQEALARAGGPLPELFRAPAGIRNPGLDPVLWRAGLTLASWTRRGYDAVERDAARITRRLLAGLIPGDVLLLHDGSAARAGGSNPVVLEVLPRVLETLAERRQKAVALTAQPPAPPAETEPAS